VHPDPRTGYFYRRGVLKFAVSQAVKRNTGLRLPYQYNFSALIHEPSFKHTRPAPSREAP
jgi:type I restriction enzyme R subunit